MPKILDRKGLRTWVEIDRKALKHNYKVLRGLIPKSVKYMSVVKSNAYGHGLIDFSLEMEKLGADWFGVDSIVEAIALREAGITKPILVLGYTLPEMLEKAIEHNVSIAVSTFELLDAIKIIKHSVFNNKSKIKVHIKVDTGMHRQGFLSSDMEKVTEKLKSLESKIEVEGLFTHFAGVKHPEFSHLTGKQLQSFKLWIKSFRDAGFSPLVHASASAGAFALGDAHFDMVRFGISQYGLWPSEEIKKDFGRKINLEPILEWKTLIGEIKNVPKGERVGYDFTEKLSRNSTIAICPIGYWHGYPRNLSSIGFVLVHSKRANSSAQIYNIRYIVYYGKCCIFYDFRI